MKKLFETWMIEQFGHGVKRLLDDYSDKDGYLDSDINGMWIGFNAGFKLAK